MNLQSSLKKVNQGDYEYIYVYYKYKGNIIRINTGNKVVPKFMNKDLTFNSRMENYLETNSQTEQLKQQVDEYIRYKFQIGSLDTISKKECVQFFHTKTIPHLPNTPKDISRLSVNELLTKFYHFKMEELTNRTSYKEYLSLSNSLLDYQKYHSEVLTLETMDTLDFLIKYRNFLTLNRGEGYLTKGGLNDNTINKRFSGLKTFFLWVEDKELYLFKKSVHNFKIPKYDNSIVVLDKDDLRQLVDLKIENPNWRKIIDLFVCNCFLGLRYSDLSTIKKMDFLTDEDGDIILQKENKKTGFTVFIPIQKTPLGILQKYDFTLPKISQQHFNREIKKIFEEYDLFHETVVKKRRVNKSNEDFETVRRNLITSHSCRRIFITLGISNNIPLNSLMLSTGHKRIQTLQNYMKKVVDKNSFKRIDL
jgi:integrase